LLLLPIYGKKWWDLVPSVLIGHKDQKLEYGTCTILRQFEPGI